MDKLQKELDDKLAQLKKTREELVKMGDKISSSVGVQSGPVGLNKDEDKEEDKKQIEEKLDEHNEKKHGEDKDEDSAIKSEVIKFEKNGQWSMKKSTMDPKPNGKLDVPVKDVYNGDDHTKEVGGKSVDGEKGKTIKVEKNP